MDEAAMQTWYYSNNGQQLGPVSFEELKALAARGALDANKDLAWTEGMPAWVPAGQVAGIFGGSPIAAAGGFNPYAAPSTASHDLLAPPAPGEVPEIPPGTYPLEIMRVMSRAMELTNRHFGSLLGIGIIYIILTAVIEGGFEWLNGYFGLGSTGVLPGGIGAGSPYAQPHTHPLISLISWTASLFLQIGLTRASLNIVSGEEATVATLFSQGDKWLKSMGATILYFLMVAVGLVLLIVPGIYLALRFVMYQHAIVDRNMGIREALQYSADLTKNNVFSVLGLGLLCLLAVIAGTIALLVGLVYAVPVVTLAFSLAYRSLQYGPAAMTDNPGTRIPLLKGICPQRQV